MGTTTGYVPYDYRRVCDMCGNLYNRSQLFRKGPYWYCKDHAQERTSEQLDRANARARPFRILPVPNAKPDDILAPDVFEAEESAVYALIDLARGAGARYALVASGSPAASPNANDVIPVNAWACNYYYGRLIETFPRGHKNVWTAQLTARMRTAADVLLALQTTTGTRATSSYYGGFLATGAASYSTENSMTAGLACLYAYRTLGDLKYLYAARAAASFLRNCQAIGSNGVNFTSSDAAGAARLYTGGITNCVYNALGFFSDHRFFPSSLLALRFWNELKLTDGDQSLGATAAIASEFTTAPSALLSKAMADLRTFWQSGTYDAITLATTTGLSSTTPAESFNAYPAAKSHFTLPGTGAWEYQDAGSGVGSTVTALSFAKAISSLYAVDGLTAQVQAIDDWLQTFTSNSDYATPGATSAAGVQHLTTGTYSAAIAPPQLLLVRDPTTRAALAKNGNSLYDWGAFGLMSPLWASRHAPAFKIARNQACRTRRRLSDGLPSDGWWDERGLVRGRQGLSWQTGFVETLEHGAGPA